MVRSLLYPYIHEWLIYLTDTNLLRMIKNDSAEVSEPTIPKIQKNEDVNNVKDNGAI